MYDNKTNKLWKIIFINFHFYYYLINIDLQHFNQFNTIIVITNNITNEIQLYSILFPIPYQYK
jgi:hypothetical protein